MRVNISYSIEFDELPIKIKMLLDELKPKLQSDIEDSVEAIWGAFDDKNYNVTIDEIASLRDNLASIDSRLDDVMHILSGYSKALVDLSAPDSQQEKAYPPELVSAVEQELSKLKEKNNV